MLRTVYHYGAAVVHVCLTPDGEVWISGADLAKALCYSNPRKAVQDHVDPEDRRDNPEVLWDHTGPPLDPQALAEATRRDAAYLSESGVYSLLLRSAKPEAKDLKRWLVAEVFPLARHQAVRVRHPIRQRQLQLLNEQDLHLKVVEYIRTFHPSAILVPGLGENQDTHEKRVLCWRKGYTRGQPDLLILNRHSRYVGLAVEFKTPAWEREASEAQLTFMEQLRRAGYRCVVSNDYDELLTEILTYFQSARVTCGECRRLFPDEEGLRRHQRATHLPPQTDLLIESEQSGSPAYPAFVPITGPPDDIEL